MSALVAVGLAGCGNDEPADTNAQTATTVSVLDRYQQTAAACYDEHAQVFAETTAAGGVEPAARRYGLSTPDGKFAAHLYYAYASDYMAYGENHALDNAVTLVREHCTTRTCSATTGTSCWHSVRELPVPGSSD